MAFPPLPGFMETPYYDKLVAWAAAVESGLAGVPEAAPVRMPSISPPALDPGITVTRDGVWASFERASTPNPTAGTQQYRCLFDLGKVSSLKDRLLLARVEVPASPSVGMGTVALTTGFDWNPATMAAIPGLSASVGRGQWHLVDAYALAKAAGFADGADLRLLLGQQSSANPHLPISWRATAGLIPRTTDPVVADVLRGFAPADYPTRTEVSAMLVGASYVTCWGDSLTALGGWDTMLASLSGLTVYNAGVGGENAECIMARQGGDAMQVTSLTIPATVTPVTVASRATDGGIKTALGKTVTPLLQGGGPHVNPVRIGDVEGTLAWTGASHSDMTGTWVFTRSTPGAAVTISRPTAMTTMSDRLRGRGLQIIFMGQNGGWADEATLVRMHQRMIDHHAGPERTLILGLSSGTASSRAAYEAAMTAAFGRRFLSLRAYLSAYGLADAGLTATPEDTTAMSEGRVPPQLLADGVHYTAACKTVIGNLVYRHMRGLGML